MIDGSPRESAMSPLRFVTSGEVKVEQLPWGPQDWLCRPDVADADQLLLARVHMPPGQAHPFHRHPAMAEIIYVLEGAAEQWVDREKASSARATWPTSPRAWSTAPTTSARPRCAS